MFNPLFLLPAYTKTHLHLISSHLFCRKPTESHPRKITPALEIHLIVTASVANVLAPGLALEAAAAVVVILEVPAAIATTTGADAIVETVEIEAAVEIAIVAIVDETIAETEMAAVAVVETETEGEEIM